MKFLQSIKQALKEMKVLQASFWCRAMTARNVRSLQEENVGVLLCKRSMMSGLNLVLHPLDNGEK
jgi:hypothetical protein